MRKEMEQDFTGKLSKVYDEVRIHDLEERSCSEGIHVWLRLCVQWDTVIVLVTTQTLAYDELSNLMSPGDIYENDRGGLVVVATAMLPKTPGAGAAVTGYRSRAGYSRKHQHH